MARPKRLLAEGDSLDERLAAQPSLGSYELAVGANQDQPLRTARLEVRTAAIVMPRPRSGVSRYVREQGVTAIAMWAVEVRKSRQPINTLRDFFRGVAGLGGFLGRKSDGEPG